MRRGDVVLATGGGPYIGAPRPAVVVQAVGFDSLASLTVCPTSTFERDAPAFRMELAPSDVNRLKERSWIMVDKISTIPRWKVRAVIGRLADHELAKLDGLLATVLGLGRRAA